VVLLERLRLVDKMEQPLTLLLSTELAVVEAVLHIQVLVVLVVLVVELALVDRWLVVLLLIRELLEVATPLLLEALAVLVLLGQHLRVVMELL
jgi:hypothetical protein